MEVRAVLWVGFLILAGFAFWWGSQQLEKAAYFGDKKLERLPTAAGAGVQPWNRFFFRKIAPRTPGRWWKACCSRPSGGWNATCRRCRWWAKNGCERKGRTRLCSGW